MPREGQDGKIGYTPIRRTERPPTRGRDPDRKPSDGHLPTAQHPADRSGGYCGDSGDSFSTVLRRMLADSALSLRQAAYRSWLDHSYLSRLVRQEWDPLNLPSHTPPDPLRRPSRDTVLRLALAMSLLVEETDELLLAAGYAPLVRGQSVPDSP